MPSTATPNPQQQTAPPVTLGSLSRAERTLIFAALLIVAASARTALLALLTTCAFAADWPAFRGANGDGIAQEDKAPLHWGPEKNIRWKAPLPGPGNSSPIVSRERVFVTCAESEGRKRCLYCFDRRTGEALGSDGGVPDRGADPPNKSALRIHPRG